MISVDPTVWADLAAHAIATTARATLVLLGALVLAFVLRRSSAASRHTVWTVTLVGLVALPVLSPILPKLRVPAPAILETASGPVDRSRVAKQRGELGPEEAGLSSKVTSERPFLSSEFDDPAPFPGAVENGKGAFELPASPGVLLFLWAVGFAGVLSTLVLGLWRSAEVVRSAEPAVGRIWTESLEQAQDASGLRRGVRLAFSSEVRTPLAGGFLIPVVLLPSSARRWSRGRRDHVLLHELVHLRRCDPLRQILGRLALALYWFHPLAWVAVRVASLAREQACDEKVVDLGKRPSAYARHLLDEAGFDSLPAPALAHFDHPPLEKRIRAILRSRSPVSPVTVVLMGLLAGGWAFTAASASPAASDDSPPTSVVGLEPSGDSSSSAAFGAEHPDRASTSSESLSPESRRADPDQGCRPREDGLDFADGEDFTGERDLSGDRFNQQSLDEFILCIRTRGDVIFAEQGTRIADLDEGAWVVLATRGEGVSRRLEVLPGPEGQEHRWSVDGARRPFDEAALRWRDAMLEVVGRGLGEVHAMQERIDDVDSEAGLEDARERLLKIIREIG